MNARSLPARGAVFAAALSLLFLLASCTAPDPDAGTATVPPLGGVPTPEPSASAVDDAAMEAAFAERDAFLEAQRLPRDGSPLVAVTDAQKQLVDEQREWSQSQGVEWTAKDEWILLALASDTCESGIMNQHRIDGRFLTTVLAGSPLVQQLIPADATDDEIAQYLRNLGSTSVFGAGFLCPDDKDAWNAAFTEAFPQ